LVICKADPKGFDAEGREPYKQVAKLPSGHEMASPVLANGLLYCRTYGGELVCLNLGASPARAAHHPADQPVRQPAAQKPRLVIKSAVYGNLPDGAKIDVTDKVANMVRTMPFRPGQQRQLHRPSGGLVKKLKVDYTFDDKLKSKTVDENQILSISNTGD